MVEEPNIVIAIVLVKGLKKMSVEYFIENEFYERVSRYSIAIISEWCGNQVPAHLVLDGREYQIYSSNIFEAADLTYEQIAWFINISRFDCVIGFGDLLEWADRPEDRHPQLLEHHLIEQLLIDMEQKGYITLHAD